MTLLSLTILLQLVISLFSYSLSVSQDSPVATAVVYNTAKSNTTALFESKTSAFSYFSVEILQISDAPAEIAFMYMRGQASYVINGELVYDGVDFDGYAQKKKRHFLSIENQNDDIYFTILSNTSISFTITLTGSNEPICENSCSENGKCMSGECYCNKGFVGKDCSVSALELDTVGEITFGGNFTEMVYLYYERTGTQKLNLEISTDSYDELNVMLIVPDLVYLPTPTVNDITAIATREKPFHIEVDQKASNDNSDQIPDRLIIAIQSLGTEISFTIKMRTVDNNTKGKKITMIIIVACSVAGFLLLCLGSICIYRARKRLQSEKQTPDMDIELREKNLVLTPQLNQNELDQFIQIVGSEQLQDKSDNCAICLDSLANKAALRTTPCKHVFHSACIEQWLAKNQFCPFCRFDLNIQNLKKQQPAPTNQIRIISRNN